MSPATAKALQAIVDGLRQPVPAPYVPLFAGAERIGALRADFAARVAACAGPFVCGRRGLESAVDGAALQQGWNAQVALLRAEGWFRAWRDETYEVCGNATAAPGLCRLERGVFRRYGLRSHAVHLNATTPAGRMWIARRSPAKAIDPGLLDNLVAGGVASGETPALTLRRECAEEAGIPAGLAAQARALTTLHARREEDEGMHDEWLHVHHLVVAEDFVPSNSDGEVAEFVLLDVDEVAAAILDGAFTEDAAAVAAQWLLAR